MQQSVQTCRERSKKELFCTSLFRASYINPYTCVCRFYPCGLLIFTPRGLSLRRLDKFNSYNAIPTNWILLPQRNWSDLALYAFCMSGGWGSKIINFIMSIHMKFLWHIQQFKAYQFVMQSKKQIYFNFGVINSWGRWLYAWGPLFRKKMISFFTLLLKILAHVS